MPIRDPGFHPVVLVLGPQLAAVSGVSAHVRTLLASSLDQQFVLEHFPIGSEGRRESRIGRVLRRLDSPRRLVRRLRQLKPALVHLNTSLNRGAFWRDMAYLLLAKLHHVRVVYQVHGGALPQQFLGEDRIRQALLRRALQLPDIIVVLARVELDAYRRFLPRRPIVQIPNGIDCTPYFALRRDPIDASSALRLIYLGRLVREKGLYELLQALAAARTQGVPAELAMVGTGPEEAGLRRAVQRLNLEAAVVFTGPAAGTVKLQLLGAADIMMLPSHAEGLPCALLEGMAAGNAVIATRVGAIADVVVEGRHGLLVPPRNVAALTAAITALAANRTALRRMGAACRRRIAREHSAERLARGFARTYAALLTDRCAG